ncbi:hypothetical protein CEUSTIGMA_g7056.t1 [Chlamydomonas eustigma]|uniref:Uncharacterized protein n=1 Tax=Chlamydomonas eustigma TaxID=1157962 RepID=A0A250X957_9CHLO|nr:hypothetical protein CEUSTIGMA_g7056.t1 [Chlamydomonas eustigma]|eukprot:GAX79615.1 hypothetical protein CEUSTIGMA_g7056.t1 [Chlamydomonas eustigma]
MLCALSKTPCFVWHNQASSISRLGLRHGLWKKSVLSPSVAANLRGIIFDYDDIIAETADLNLQSYNAAFKRLQLKHADGEITWNRDVQILMERYGNSSLKTKLANYFEEEGWPMSSLHNGSIPCGPEQKKALLDELQHCWEEHYQRSVSEGYLDARPGVLRLMDEAREAGLKLAVCSNSPKSSVEEALLKLLGPGRFNELACFLSADSDALHFQPVQGAYLKLYPEISKRLDLDPSECLVIEDRSCGLQEAREAGMRCIVIYTEATKDQSFPGAERILNSLGSYPALVTIKELQECRIVQDDRIEMSMTDGAVFWHIPGQ